MDNNNPQYQSTNPVAEGTGAQSPVTSNRKVGPIVAGLVIVLIVIIAALYLFASKVNEEPVPAANNEAAPVERITSTSDNPEDIQNDLNAATQGLEGQNF